MAKNNSNSGFRISKIFTRNPNWMATILVIIFLAVVYCYFGNDLLVFTQAETGRKELAKQAAEEIMYNEELNMQFIKDEMKRMNNSIQELKYSTDLGEYFAANDLTPDGRKDNTRAIIGIMVIIICCAVYVFTNFIRMLLLFARNDKKSNKVVNGKFQS